MEKELLVAGCGTKCNFLATSAGSVAFPGFITLHETLKVSSLHYSVCCLSKYYVFYASDEYTMYWILAAALKICIIRLSKLQEKEIPALDFKGEKNPNVCHNTYLSWLLWVTRIWISLKKLS